MTKNPDRVGGSGSAPMAVVAGLWLLARRVPQAVLVLWAAFTISYGLLYLLPGDPVRAMLSGAGGESSTPDPAQVAALRTELGLDEPIVLRYLHALGAVVTGDLGQSIRTGTPVVETLAEALPHTAALAGSALLLAVVLGTGLAMASTTGRGPLGRLPLTVAAVGVSLPPFWVGLVLVQQFSFRWRWFPAIGNEGAASLVLPAVTLAIPVGALLTQVLARSLRETLTEPYVDTAIAKGAGRARVHLRHAIRNAAIPVLALLGLIVGNLVGGAVVVETVFARSGIGRMVVDAVNARDFPLVQGVVLLSAAVFVLASLTIDLLLPLVDPRIRFRLRTDRKAGASG